MIDLNQLPPDLLQSQGGFNRQAALAKLLQERAMTPQQGQMVSGHYVSPGIMGLVAPLAQAYMGQKLQSSADAGTQEIAGKYNERLAEGLTKYQNTRMGNPGEQQSTLAPDQAGPEMVEGFQKANPRQAAVEALTSGLGPLHELGKLDLTQMGKAPGRGLAGEKFTHPPQEVLGPEGRPVLVLIGDQGTRLPITEFAPKQKFMTVGERVLDESDPTKVVGDYRPQFGNKYDYKGDVYQDDKGTGQSRKLDNAPKTSISLTASNIVPKGETKFSETLGAGRAKNFLEAETNAATANRTLGSIVQLRELEAKGITSGRFAEPANAVAEVAASLGIPVDRNKLANTQGYDQQISKQVASVLTQGGGVGRSMTDEDRKAFQKSLPSRLLTSEGRAEVYAQMERDAHSDIQHYRGLQSTLQENPVYKDSPGMLTVDPVGQPGGRIPAAGNVPPTSGRTSSGEKPKTIIKGW
jgi:hypothetical protein